MHTSVQGLAHRDGNALQRKKRKNKKKRFPTAIEKRGAYKSSIDYKEKASRWWKRIKGDGGLARMHVLHPSIRPDKSPFANGL